MFQIALRIMWRNHVDANLSGHASLR